MEMIHGHVSVVPQATLSRKWTEERLNPNLPIQGISSQICKQLTVEIPSRKLQAVDRDNNKVKNKHSHPHCPHTSIFQLA
jgi:hypothetical protein